MAAKKNPDPNAEKLYTVNRDLLQHDGEDYGMGEPITLTDAKQIKALEDLGAIIPAEK